MGFDGIERGGMLRIKRECKVEETRRSSPLRVFAQNVHVALFARFPRDPPSCSGSLPVWIPGLDRHFSDPERPSSCAQERLDRNRELDLLLPPLHAGPIRPSLLTRLTSLWGPQNARVSYSNLMDAHPPPEPVVVPEGADPLTFPPKGRSPPPCPLSPLFSPLRS